MNFASARRLLPKIAGNLGIALPMAQKRVLQKVLAGDFPDLSLRCSLAEVGEVALEPVSGSADKERWRDGNPSSATMEAPAGCAKVLLDHVARHMARLGLSTSHC